MNPGELTLVHLANRQGWRGHSGNGLSGTEQSSLGIFARPSTRLFTSACMESTNLGITVGRPRAVGARFVGKWRFLDVLGVRPALGRLFTASDDRPGCGASGVVVSYAFWQRQLGGNPQAISSTLTIGRHAVPILGVTPDGFTGPEVGHSFDVAAPICSQSAYWTEETWLDSSTDWWRRNGPPETWRFLIHGECRPQSLSPAAFEASVRKDYPKENLGTTFTSG